MSRVEENKEWMDQQPRQFTGDYKDIEVKIKMCIYTTLLDISRSLAYIADNTGDKESSNNYLRDKLLIQWCVENISNCAKEYVLDETEQLYSKWMKDLGGKLDGK